MENNNNLQTEVLSLSLSKRNFFLALKMLLKNFSFIILGSNLYPQKFMLLPAEMKAAFLFGKHLINDKKE